MIVSKDFTFCASHILPRHPGKCSRLHGHNWIVRVELEGQTNPQSQFVMDYADLTTIVDPLIERFDHRHLNAFVEYPSAENIAAHFANLVRKQLKVNIINWLRVGVSETVKTWAYWDSRIKSDLAMLNDPEGQWRAPKVEVPTLDIRMLKDDIRNFDCSIAHLLNELNQTMTKREQYAVRFSEFSDEKI
jgi:6-pyruvoyltetrahydropterin/6-carboxytetrahydropterin synthase